MRHSRSYLSALSVAVENSSSFGSIAALGINGLAGLGPGFSSVVRGKIGTKGDTLLDNIFQVSRCPRDAHIQRLVLLLPIP